MDWLPDTTWTVAIVLVVLGAIYWFFFRDDNGFPEPEKINIKIKPGLPGMNRPKAPTAVKRTDGKPLKILFYTQTGTAEDFARRLGDDATNYHFSPDVLEVEGFDGESLANEPAVVFFASTYGEGDPPDNAIEFHEWLMDSAREPDCFSGLKYAVFGLGNKTYPEYNQMGKRIDKRLEELGATRMYQLGLGDDDDNIENDFLVWKKGFAPVLCQEFGLDPPGDISTAKMIFKQRLAVHEPDDPKIANCTKEELDLIPKWRIPKKPQTTADRNVPILASLLTKRELHKEGSGRSCLHIEVSTHKDILQYQTGDHIGVYPENEDHLVHQLAKLLSIDLTQVVSIYDINNDAKPVIGPCTIRALLKQHFDIAFYAKKPLLRVLAQFAEDKDQQSNLFQLSSDEPGNVKYDEYIVKGNRTIMEVLQDFPSVKVPLAHFFEHCPKLLPRYYSISSSPHQHTDTVHITAVVTNWTTSVGREANGVATTWLSRTDLPASIPSFIRKSTFRLPTNVTVPIIMVGPGTGLAPFRGFLQEIKYRKALPQYKDAKFGEVTLFFGCRSRTDYLYEDELEAYHKEGILTDLHVAFSRIGTEKEYVQHLMKKGETPQKIWNALKDGGFFYVCGDAKLMARDVANALAHIVSEHGGLEIKDAEKYIEKMTSEGRLQQDVWS